MNEEQRSVLRLVEEAFDVEILPRHREPEQLPDWLDHADLDPSWGPLGSLAARYDGEHTVLPVSPSDAIEPASEPPAQNRVLDASEALLRLDAHGETPLYACPLCGEESAKANVNIERWHCTACDSWGPVQRPRPRPTQVHEV